MNRLALAKLTIGLVVGLALGGCGGGSGTADTSGGGTSTPTTATCATITPTLTLKLVDATDTAVTAVNGSEQAYAKATLKYSSGSKVTGNLVTFSTTIGALSGNGSAVTDSSGVATLVVTAGAVEGGGQISATASLTDSDCSKSVTSNSVAFSSDGNGSTTPGGASANLQATMTLTPKTITRATPGTATVTVTDGDGAAVADAIVAFTVTNGSVANAAKYTDASGVATTTVSAGSTAGTSTLSAKVTFGSLSATPTSIAYITDGDAVPTVDLELTVPAVSGTVTKAEPATATATVTGADGNPAAAALVTFTVSGGKGTLAVGEVLTSKQVRANSSGVATATLFAGTTAGAGSISASATVGGSSVSSSAIEYDTAGDDDFPGVGTSNLNIAIQLVDTDGVTIDPPYIDADTPGILKATVTNAQGTGVPNIVVRFAADLGDLFPLNGLVLTDSSGVATVSLTAGSTPGAGNASASIVIDGQTYDSDSMTFSTLGNAGDTPISVTLTFTDATPGSASNIITTSEPGTLTVLVEETGGTNLPNRSATIKTTLGRITTALTCPTEAAGSSTLTAVTDSDGKIQVRVCGYSTIGTGSIGVTVGDTTKTVQFDVGVDGLQIGSLVGAVFTAEAMTISVDPLSAGGTSKVTVWVVDAAETPIADIDISFTSQCAETDEAQISATATSDATGAAIATYLAKGCVGNDTITATETSSGATASGLINVLPAQIGSITFVSVDDDTIQIKGTGKESTNVTFQVLDVENQPAADQDVSFDLTNHVGGLSLVSSTGLTDTDGLVRATVAAGYIPTSVQVKASVEVDTNNDGVADTTLETLSGKLRVNTGIADQNSMSISSPDSPNVEGNNIDGITATITVRMSDAFNNPVADNTTVEFQTELGSVEPACATLDGVCSVAFITSDPRTPLNPNVNFRNLVDDRCPSNRVTEEQVTVASDGTLKGETNYRIDVDRTVVVKYSNGFNYVYLTEGTGFDYRLETDGTGITCLATSAQCVAGKKLYITYDRLWVDEDPYDSGLDGSTVTVSGGVAAVGAAGTMDTDVLPEVYDSSDRLLKRTTDYTVTADGSGITCVSTSTECVNGAVLTIYYDSAAAGKPHVISHPGVATKPWTNVTGVPCEARARAATAEASAYFGGLGQPYGGRSTVLAYALGEESFIDTNGNGQYDYNEPFVDLPEAFVDKNEDGVFGNGDPSTDDSRNHSNPNCYGPRAPVTNPDEVLNKCFQEYGEEEVFIDFGSPTTLNGKFDAGNGIYNGTLCPKEVSDRTSTCDNLTVPCTSTDRYCTRNLVNIRRSFPILMSGSTAFVGVRGGADNELISTVDLTGALTSSQYSASSTVYANDGTAIGPGTPFTVGDAESSTEVAPGVGELTTLTAGSGAVYLDLSDLYNGYLPASATVSVVSGTNGCVVQNTPGGKIGNGSGTGFSTVFVSLGRPSSPPSGGAEVTVTVTTDDGNVITYALFNCAY